VPTFAPPNVTLPSPSLPPPRYTKLALTPTPRPVPSIIPSSPDSGTVSGVLDSSEEEPPPVFSLGSMTNQRARPPRPWLGWTFGAGGTTDTTDTSANQESGWSRLARYLLIGKSSYSMSLHILSSKFFYPSFVFIIILSRVSTTGRMFALLFRNRFCSAPFLRGDRLRRDYHRDRLGPTLHLQGDWQCQRRGLQRGGSFSPYSF
jgi:hypothetical protein